MQLGPDARNLSGCRNAADRICAFIEDSEAEQAANAKKAVSQKKTKNPKQEKDLSWNNFGNEHFNAYSVSIFIGSIAVYYCILITIFDFY